MKVIMVNYDELPLFPLHVVLYPEMPLPLHIFEPRYREMVHRCRAANSPFGVILIREDEAAVPHSVGTAARITHHEALPDGRMNIIVTGETRFRVLEVQRHRPYLTARVEPVSEEDTDPARLAPPFKTVSGMFRDYLRSVSALAGRPLSALQLPQDPEFLSYAIAMFLQIPLSEKQRLLEMTATEARLRREIELLGHEIEAQETLQKAVRTQGRCIITPVDTEALGKLASRN
ncbi:MAG: LON peptidase substrate-binding domain-containing protein [Armatimonadetes bacterium]|nr:LON peptidase substrate-binding domain-containing protein [Armatimonadota bacterium]